MTVNRVHTTACTAVTDLQHELAHVLIVPQVMRVIRVELLPARNHTLLFT